jgi:hypothetical protein
MGPFAILFLLLLIHVSSCISQCQHYSRGKLFCFRRKFCCPCKSKALRFRPWFRMAIFTVHKSNGWPTQYFCSFYQPSHLHRTRLTEPHKWSRNSWLQRWALHRWVGSRGGSWFWLFRFCLLLKVFGNFCKSEEFPFCCLKLGTSSGLWLWTW